MSRRKYENLKLKLASEFKNDRVSYVLGKTEFLNKTLDIISGKASSQQDT